MVLAFSSLRNSIGAKLAVAAITSFLAIAAVLFVTLDRLSDVDAISADVRNRWLTTVRIIGDLSQRVASVRTEEIELALANRRSGTAELLKQNLETAEKDIREYHAVGHDPDEVSEFETFLVDWAGHRRQAQEIAGLASSERKPEALALIEGSARGSYLGASGTLRRLAELTNRKADAARFAAAEAIEQAQVWVSGVLLATVLLFIALGMYLWRSLSRPLLDLANRMRQLALYDTNQTVPFQNRMDEVGEMARALAIFRSNTIELLKARGSLQDQAEMLARSLDKERAIAAEERNFIRTMSHEFRTPLTNIDGQAQRLLTRKDRTDPAEIAERANKIRAATFRMTNLVASLTEAMERTRSALKPKIRAFDLRSMLLDLVSYYREIGASGPLDQQIETLPAQIDGDPQLLHFAFSNLISNAFKYSPEGEPVTLKARAVGGWIEINVEDHGVGIPEAEIERVRERYFRGSNVGSIPGTGLGLHLVEEILREHGGRLRIESRCGEGTRVTVCLPDHSDASAGESHK